MRRTRIGAGLACALGLMASGCSGEIDISFGGQSPEEAAVELIEGDLEETLGLGELIATCESPGTDEVGTEFGCTADASGTELQFDVEIDAEDHIFVQPTNVLSLEDLASFEVASVEVLNQDFDAGMGPDAMDCGDELIPIDRSVDAELLCALTSPATGDVYDATITITNFDTGRFNVQVAEEPRP